MARLRMMRAPQKICTGKRILCFKFHEEMKDLGNKILVCLFKKWIQNVP